MAFILLVMANETKIDADEVEQILRNLTFASDFNDSDSDVFVCEYIMKHDRTTIRVYQDESRISIDGMGPASLEAAFEIATHYSHPLRLFDEDYTFDIDLSKIGSVADLEKRVTEGCYDSFE